MHLDDHRDAVEAARRRAGLSVHELWLGCFELGGDVGPLELEAYLHGLMPLAAAQRDVLSQAVNERLAELGLGGFVGYSFDGDH